MRRSPHLEPGPGPESRPGHRNGLLPVLQAAQIQTSQGPSWLVEDLWGEEAVGIVGGMAKSCKSWLALDLAISVASGTPVLGSYEVQRPGPVLVFAAEDRPAEVRTRLEGLCVSRGLDLARIPVHVILASVLRLETASDQERLSATVAHYRPRLLVLDPFVRLSRIDENSAQEVSGLLAYLRELQRTFHLAVLVVHHTRKSQAANGQAGLGLRGSGDFHAWGDSNLYLKKRQDHLELSIEHRSAPSPKPVELALDTGNGRPPHLAVIGSLPLEVPGQDLKMRILELLGEIQTPITHEALRERLRVRSQRLSVALRDLQREGRLQRGPAGWSLSP